MEWVKIKYKVINYNKKSAFIFLCVLSMLFARVSAQVNMTRTIFNAPYTPISVAGGATASPNGLLRLNIPIGFVFNYLGNNFINVSISTYGFICLGSTSTSSGVDENVNFFTTASAFPPNTLAPYADYLASSNALILYQTQGTAGSRSFIVQWTDVNSYSTSSTRNFINFQVILYEGTNVIEFRYGFSTITTPHAQESASIGIRSTGGAGGYIDAVTGSSYSFYAMGNSGPKWPVHHFRFTPGAPAPLAAGTYNVGIGQTYATLEDATADLNHRGVSGPVVFNLTDTLYEYSANGGYNQFPVLIGPVSGVSPTNTVTYTSSVNPRITSSATAFNGTAGNQSFYTSGGPAINNSREPILALMGARYVTIENVRLTTPAANPVQRGILVTNISNTMGSQYNTIKNISISMKTAGVGIDHYAYISSLYTHTPAGTSSHNKYLNLTIDNGRAGIYFYSSNNHRDSNNVVGTTAPGTYNQITQTSNYGIYARLQKNLTVFNTEILNNRNNTIYDAIYYEQSSGNIKCYNNKIHHLTSTSTAGALSGIRTYGMYSANSDSLSIYNNFIYNLSSSYSGSITSTNKVVGMDIMASGYINIDHNSIAITGPVNGSSAALSTYSGNDFNNIRNNILANYTPAQTGSASHYAWFSGDFSSAPLAVIDYNNFYIANPTNGFIAGDGPNYSNLSALQSASGKNLNSVVITPPFTNYLSDLHLNGPSYNGTGTIVPYITKDIDDDPRNNPPAMGADEYLVLPCSSADAGTISALSTSFCEGLSTTLTAAGATTAPGISYQWKISSLPGGPYLNVSGGSGATTASYTTAALLPGTYYFVFEATCENGPVTDLSNELMITVNPKPSVGATATEYTICRGASSTLTASGADTYTWLPGPVSGNGIIVAPLSNTTYTVTGTQTATGCSNTTTLLVQVNALPPVSASATPTAICAGGSTNLTATGADNYTWMPGSLSGSTVSVSPSSTTTYTVTGTDAGTGCTNTATRNVVVNLPHSTNLTISACNSYTLNSTTYNISGNYTQTLTNRFGCDSIIHLNLTIKNSSSSTQNVNTCNTYTWPVNGNTYTNSITTTHTILNAVGCDSVVTLNLTIRHSTSSAQNVSVCNTYTWPVNGTTYTSSTTATHTLTNAAGCDSVVTLNLTIKHSTTATQNITACNTYTWPVNGTTYTNSTAATHTLTNAAGCDSVITLNLTIKHSTTATQNITACNTYTWPVNGTTYTNSTTATHTLTNAAGCDSVITLNLTIKYSTTATQNVTACNTYTWPVNGNTYTSSTTTTHTLTNAAGCDSVITLNLTIKHSTTATQNITACNTYTWPVNGNIYTSSTTATHTLTNIAGCDSVITLNLTIKHSTTATQNVTTCNTYTWPVNGNIYTSSTTATRTLTNIAGCDSVITLNLTIKHSTTATQNVTTCNTYTWPVNGNTYTNSTTATHTLTNAAGCDSVITLNLTIKHSTTAMQNVTACNTYTWPVNGNTYTSSTTATHTLTNVAGCDSVITLNLIIKNSNTATQNMTACNTYTWPVNGNTYTSSITATHTLTNIAGCDSVITLNLTIKHSTTATQNVTACNTYTWPVNGNTYTSSTTATHTLTNAAGCDSVITLNLIIKNSNTATQNMTACNTYTWPVNGNTYTSSTTATHTLTNAAGCDSVITLNLIIKNSNTATQNMTACDTYTWPVNGNTYTSSTTATHTLTNAAGCDSVITLNLIIKNSNTATQNMTACDTYTWPVNGNTYTSSTTATHTLTNVAGCDSVITLNLTINHSTTATQNMTACDTYTWPVNGNTYTNSITATHTLTNVAGCDSVITLNLTINHSNTATQNITACDTYTWPVNGNIYTSSATVTHTLTNSAGCDSVITLDLTIYESSSSTLFITACNTYTLNAITYTTGGTYTQTLTNAHGCDSIITLNLALNIVNTNITQTGLLLQAPAGADSYQWVDCSNAYAIIPGETNMNFTATMNGNYAVIVTDNTCSDTSSCITINNVGIQEAPTSLGLQVYPNPSDGLYTIKFTSSLNNASLQVYNTSGQIISVFAHVNGELYTIDLTEQPAGMYYLRLIEQQQVYTHTLIKK